ncbi:MAG: CD225/dispanin family protein [Bacteroidales bacterium]|nr:CD225/dispanin family protein [Bacteroidales bacterium]MBP5517877.1 CD225/dispanin family protein [Bacteroidales bacterium]MBP5693709.1 CD225/dispanin family protein [Bacteroidales bacterium]
MEDNYQGYDPSQNQWQGQDPNQQQGYGYQNQQPNYGYQQNYQNQQNPYGYQQGYQQGYPYGNQPPKPSNNLVWGILTTICCCLPFGIVSIVFAAKVDSLYYSGRYEEAQTAARKAGTWAVVAAIVGFLSSCAYGILQLYAAKKGLSLIDTSIFDGTGLY